MINYIKDDITKVERGLIVHGCNCSGGFGSGVAGAIRKKWPNVAARHQYQGVGEHLLGTLDIVYIKNGLYVGNGYTQVKFGSDGKKYASVSAIDAVLVSAFRHAAFVGLDSISIPKIGAGLGGLSWDDEVEPLVSNIYKEYSDLNKNKIIDLNIYYID